MSTTQDPSWLSPPPPPAAVKPALATILEQQTARPALATAEPAEPVPASGSAAAGNGAPIQSGADQEKPGTELHLRLHTRAMTALRELRFVSERPSSLRDHIAYARAGEWTTQIDGRIRDAALLYAAIVAIPVTTIAFLLVWAVSRPARCAVSVALTLTVGTALAGIPVLGWLVPNWMTFGFWPPFCWIF